jgi:hypothetical protein
MDKIKQLIYLAGYIDGDGCFRANITTQKTGYIVYERSLTISSVKKEPLVVFKNLLGGAIREEQKQENHKKIYAWTIKGDASLKASEKIQPFLVMKKEECSIFIRYCKSISEYPIKQVGTQILKVRDSLIDEIRDEIHHAGLIAKDLIEDIRKNRSSIKPTEEDYIYLAGLIDAEGCFRVSKRFRKSTNIWIYNTCLEIGNTKIKMMQWLSDRFGGSICYIPTKRINRRDSATWCAHSQILYPILIKVVDHLINKKEVCNELIKFQKTILTNGGDRHSSTFKEKYKAVLQERELIVEKIHLLNHKGI